ncbi:hypothetical protein Pst134EA_026019 [Puccinia striiformis f. sp. tritici]|uniref:hypothetical protein n=1 Tax=Puccinia striiformis f. sp. tritici TaxID=168172 RepID=UPI002007E08C|nr:hypothetical protein Pst134EA_026019 [Puccinia striiformis f. sp. tritici]KAH9452084.1 hypothetical protein Pst134EA_026019 [Puccinia striiformis f. sp. tritici]
MTAAEIWTQVNDNWAMRIRMSYARLVMAHYYVHNSRRTLQWLEIDKRLGVLRGSSIQFQQALMTFQRTNSLSLPSTTFEQCWPMEPWPVQPWPMEPWPVQP